MDAETLTLALKALPVIILGETGTGKELVARAIHDRSAERHMPLIKVNCAALPAGLVESELFGALPGAHSTATRKSDLRPVGRPHIR